MLTEQVRDQLMTRAKKTAHHTDAEGEITSNPPLGLVWAVLALVVQGELIRQEIRARTDELKRTFLDSMEQERQRKQQTEATGE